MPKTPYASRVEDPQRKPGDRDRSALVARIKRAADEGRIGPADRDIRLGNVASAQTLAELDLMGRDLDQLEAAVHSSAATVPPAWTGPTPPPLADEVSDAAVSFAKSTARSVGVLTAVILALVLVGAGASALLAFRSSGDSSSGGLLEPEPIPSAGTDDPSPGESSEGASPSSGAAYALTGPGIRAFLSDYRARFDTTVVVDLTLYDDYAVVQVPRAGTHRHAGFLFRPASGWTDFGGVTANFPGAAAVDLRKLDVPALIRNIARARRTLNVEDFSVTYVSIDYRPQFDDAPNVNIHVSNPFNESGYLATRLDGTVERAYPFSQ
jgi:hypothetical protein